MKSKVDRILTCLIYFCQIMAAFWAYQASEVTIDFWFPPHVELTVPDKPQGFAAFRDNVFCGGGMHELNAARQALQATIEVAENCARMLASVQENQEEVIVLINNHAVFAMMSTIGSIILMLWRARWRRKFMHIPPVVSEH